MKSNFNFKSLLKRMPNVSVPKEFIYFGIGIVLIIIIGLIASNMYLQEMLFFEGQEKSLQMFTEEELREYGELYKELSLDFQNEIGSYVQGYARREGSGAKYFVNRAGERIYYGVFNHEHPTDDTNKIKIHNNGQNINAADDGHMSDYDDSMNTFKVNESYIDSDEFKNGVAIKYSKTDGREDGESNYKDILTVVSMLVDQKQSDNTYNNSTTEIDLKRKIPKLIENLFKMSHIYNGDITDLYSCNKGCRVLFYYCNEVDNGDKGYVGTGIDLQPFPINPHDDFDDYSSEDFELTDPVDECEICGHNGKGCVLDSEKCYHGTEDEEKGPHYLGRGMTLDFIDVCTKCHDVNDCQHECDGCGGEELGCIHECDSGCYDCFCDGHDHWNCPGHFYVCCMGHRDVTVKIKIMYIDEILNTIENGYNPAD